MLVLRLLLLLVGLALPAVHAAAVVVTTAADSGAGSLREALDWTNANPGADEVGTRSFTHSCPLIASGRSRSRARGSSCGR